MTLDNYVTIFVEPRAERTIRRVKPDVLIKGEDWSGKRVDGQAFVESRGGLGTYFINGVLLLPAAVANQWNAHIARRSADS